MESARVDRADVGAGCHRVSEIRGGSLLLFVEISRLVLWDEAISGVEVWLGWGTGGVRRDV